MHPELKQHFSEFKNIDIGRINGTHGHPKRLLMAIDNAVTAMGDSESFSAYLVELGRRHNMPNIQPSHDHVSRRQVKANQGRLLYSQEGLCILGFYCESQGSTAFIISRGKRG